jgi:beta-glucanase (GH16 family)
MYDVDEAATQEIPVVRPFEEQEPRAPGGLAVVLTLSGSVAVGLAVALVLVLGFWPAPAGSPPTPTRAAAAPTPTRAPAAPVNRQVTLAPGDDTEAAVLNGWPRTGGDEFDGPALDPTFWRPYEGGEADGGAVRTPDALSVDDGLLTITARGQESGGMAWLPGQSYGRWEVRARADRGAGYRPAVLLWPDAEDWPAGGEIDLLDAPQPNRDRTDFVVHHGSGDLQDTTTVVTDVTQWHNYAVEWGPGYIVGYVDGQQVYRTDNPAMIPTRPMHLAIQQDVGPSANGRTPALDATTPDEVRMQVDWVRIYGM